MAAFKDMQYTRSLEKLKTQRVLSTINPTIAKQLTYSFGGGQAK